MANIFISHSSQDKQVANRLAADFKDMGHTSWFDEWEIRVGECIPTMIEHGLSEADYVVVLLSEHAVSSPWVERKWKAKYWEEINTGNIQILPALIDDCEPPLLLRTKRYADFRTSYATGLVRLTAAIDPVLPISGTVITELPHGTGKEVELHHIWRHGYPSSRPR